MSGDIRHAPVSLPKDSTLAIRPSDGVAIEITVMLL